MKTADWALEDGYWRCRWCGATQSAEKAPALFDHEEGCAHYWDEPPAKEPEDYELDYKWDERP